MHESRSFTRPIPSIAVAVALSATTVLGIGAITAMGAAADPIDDLTVCSFPQDCTPTPPSARSTTR